MRASHLLIKHEGSRRQASWLDPDGVRIKATTKAQAEAQLLELKAQISGAADFARLASERSDCSSAKNGGDLGEFGPGQMQKAFEDGVLALEIGQISGVIHSDSGSHLILRTG